jgi:hypothetical protein
MVPEYTQPSELRLDILDRVRNDIFVPTYATHPTVSPRFGDARNNFGPDEELLTKETNIV